MKPIMQKNIHNPEKGIMGDCLRACICSLLEISDENIPNFAEDTDYPMQLINFLKSKGYRLKYSIEEPINIEYYMVWGLSPRNNKHSVIYHNGKLVHDPHPMSGGVLPTQYVWLERRK